MSLRLVAVAGALSLLFIVHYGTPAFAGVDDASKAFEQACQLKTSIHKMNQRLADEHKAGAIAGFVDKATLYQYGKAVATSEQGVRHWQSEYKKATGKTLDLNQCKESEEEEFNATNQDSLTDVVCTVRQQLKQSKQVVTNERETGRRTGYVNSATLHEAALAIVMQEKYLPILEKKARNNKWSFPAQSACNQLALAAQEDANYPNSSLAEFHAAALTGSLAEMQRLIKTVKINGKDPTGHTALMNAVTGRSLEVVKYLLDNHADVNLQTRKGNTALMIAAEKGPIEIVQYLLDKHADVNTRNQGGGSPLSLAATAGTPEVVDLLLKHGAHVNDRAQDQTTALYLAAARGNSEIVKLLLKSGSIVGLKNKNGLTAADIAIKQGHPDIAELLGVPAEKHQIASEPANTDPARAPASDTVGKSNEACADNCGVMAASGKLKQGMSVQECIKLTCN